LTKFGSFGLFWADSAAMAVLTVLPSFERKKKEKVITFAESVRILCVMACWKALELPIYQKSFKKIQLQTGIVVACPKFLNSIYGTYNTLGANP
jgi:succinate-acetate transporter protein